MLLRFEGHTTWSLSEMEDRIQKLIGYLDSNKIAFSREIGEYGAFQIEIAAVDLFGFLSFIVETLHAPRSCLHFPYQTLCLNGAR